jgi:hypothetical protein
MLSYYGHFADTYRVLFARISSEVVRPVADTDPGGRTLAQRLEYVPYALGIFLGWPNLLLGALGAAWLWRR